MRVTVIGTGYVGLVSGTCIAEMGNSVVCHDIDPAKISMLRDGRVPIYEPGLAELVRTNVAGKRLTFTTDLAAAVRDSEVVFIAVGTPPAEDGSADLKHVLDCARDIAKVMTTPAVIAVKSTVPVGTCDKVREVVGQTLSEGKQAHAFDVVSNPEFLKEGAAVDDFMRPDRIVVGADSEQGEAVMRKLYQPFIRNNHPFVLMDVRSSEMTKYASNVMLAARISMVNELASICEKVGADIMSVRQGVGHDRRIGLPFLYAGVGYGGSCLPKDVRALAALAQANGIDHLILEAIERVNHRQKNVVAERVLEHFNGDIKGKRIALWGLAFKPKTDDIREAPSLTVIERVLAAGATVCAFDPEATANARKHFEGRSSITFADDAYAACEGADALCLVTEWSIFRAPDFERLRTLMRTPLIVDGRNQYDPAELRRLGFAHIGIGRPVA